MTDQIKRYGTSASECPNGIFVLHSEYEKVVVELEAWRARFPAYVYRPQDGCVASRMGLERPHDPVECSQWRWQNGMGAPKTCARCGLGPCREPSVNKKEQS